MSFFNRDYDFDFHGDKSNRLAPFIIGFLMYSVTIAIMSAFFTRDLTSGWKEALNGRVTVEFQSNVCGADETLTDKQHEEITKVIKSAGGVKSVKKLQESDILKVLEPWLNGAAIPDDFPFPAIYDVETEKDAKIDLLAMRDKLSKISYGVKIHDHANWYAPISKISLGLFGFAIILSVLIFATVCATVVFITRKALDTHLSAVKILQLIGANNAYVATQFKRYYFAVGCKSSLISILCSFLTIFGIIFLSEAEPFDLVALKYAIAAVVVPFFTALLVMIAAKNTVLFFLKNDKWVG
jgi:cell division transport system permease protein